MIWLIFLDTRFSDAASVCCNNMCFAGRSLLYEGGGGLDARRKVHWEVESFSSKYSRKGSSFDTKEFWLRFVSHGHSSVGVNIPVAGGMGDGGLLKGGEGKSTSFCCDFIGELMISSS